MRADGAGGLESGCGLGVRSGYLGEEPVAWAWAGRAAEARTGPRWRGAV
ncbi:hypothetical protein BS35_007839 [Actinomadura glauciflava]|nr:hypothetical protein [Actinomadura glauciflava]